VQQERFLATACFKDFTFFVAKQPDWSSVMFEPLVAQQQPAGEEAVPWQKSITRPSGHWHWTCGNPAVTVVKAANVASNFVNVGPSRYIHLPPK
jgi:hypothetical protein